MNYDGFDPNDPYKELIVEISIEGEKVMVRKDELELMWKVLMLTE